MLYKNTSEGVCW